MTLLRSRSEPGLFVAMGDPLWGKIRTSLRICLKLGKFAKACSFLQEPRTDAKSKQGTPSVMYPLTAAQQHILA